MNQLIKNYTSLRKLKEVGVNCERLENKQATNISKNLVNRFESEQLVSDTCANCIDSMYSSCSLENDTICNIRVIVPDTPPPPFSITNRQLFSCYDNATKSFAITERYTFTNAAGIVFLISTKNNIQSPLGLSTNTTGNIFTITYMLSNPNNATTYTLKTLTALTDGTTFLNEEQNTTIDSTGLTC